MTDADDRKREARLRRIASLQGLRIQKSRQRSPELPGYGGYMLVNDRNYIEMGATSFAYSASLDDVADYLAQPAD
jgi:hypothetical protein